MTAMKRFSFVVLLGVLTLPFAVSAASLDVVNSRVGAENAKTEVHADGIDNVRIIVTVKDTNLMTLEGKTVVLASSRGNLDEIRTESATTDILGKAYFLVDSLKDGSSVYTASVDGQTLQKTVTITYTGGLVANIKDGDLIKIPDDGNVATLSDTAVYYYAANGKRYVFPNDRVYFTWYPDFSKVQTITLDQMSLIPLGGNVTYKSGSKLVKFQTDVKTYLPTKGGVLRWVQTEEAARGIFGADWNHQVDDVSEAFYANYTFGTPIATALDAPLDVIRAMGGTIDADKGL